MVASGVCARVCLRLTAALACSSGIVCGQAFDTPVQQAESSQKTEGWPGQIRAYTEFAEQLGGEDYRAQQDPDHAQIYRPDYQTMIGLIPDEVGALWSTLVTAETRCKELDSGFYAQYPRLTPDQEQEQAAKPDAAALIEKEYRVLADMRSKKREAVSNAIGELRLQLGHDDFLRLDNWVRDHFGPKGPVQHHKAVHRTQTQ